jgi:hypothetical protein
MQRVLEDEIRDLQRIIAADLSILELEKSRAKRTALNEEIGDAREKIERLERQIANLGGG